MNHSVQNSEPALQNNVVEVNLVPANALALKEPRVKLQVDGSLTDLNEFDCGESTCSITVPEELAASNGLILLMDGEKVVAVVPYNTGSNDYLFPDALDMGRYVLQALNSMGLSTEHIVESLEADSMSQAYQSLSAIYQASDYELDATATALGQPSCIDDLQTAASVTELAEQASFAYHPASGRGTLSGLKSETEKTPADHALQILNIAAKVPVLKTYAGPAASVFKGFGEAFGILSKELTLHDIMQKLKDLEKQLEGLVGTLNTFYNEYNADQAREDAQKIALSLSAINSVNQQLFNQLGRHGSDVKGYVSYGWNKNKRIDKLAEILNANALREIQTHADILRDTSSERGVLPGYFEHVTRQVAAQIKQADDDQDLMPFYEVYNTWLIAQYNLIATALSQALYLELAALYLKLAHNAEVFPAADYGPNKDSGDFHKMATYLRKQYAQSLSELTDKLNQHIIPTHLVFDQNGPNASLDFAGHVVDEKGIFSKYPTHAPVLLATKQVMAVYDQSKGKVRFYSNDGNGFFKLRTCDPLGYNCHEQQKSCSEREGTSYSIDSIPAGTEVIIQPKSSNYTKVVKNTCPTVTLTEEQVSKIKERFGKLN